jgi:hypothetical protein
MKAAAANSLWLAGCVAEYARFRRGVRRVEPEQRSILKRALAENAETDFGRRHGFARIRSVREYQERVPLRQFDDFREWTDRIEDGAPDQLTRVRVRLLEPTSGTSLGNAGADCAIRATKLIPYTKGLSREFQAGIRAWIADLFLSDPKLLDGEAYWSVSPAASATNAAVTRTRGGIPIGFDDDTSYVGGWQQRLVAASLAVPAAVREISDMAMFRYVTLLFLARSRDLRLISVWNPTFLSLLVERLPEWGEDIARDLERGTVRGSDGALLPRGVRGCSRANAARARELRAALRTSSPAELHAALWPRLRCISCWADANAAAPTARLAVLFPQARVQPKGLIATEGFVSLPLAGREGAALAVRSHFLEFLPCDPRGEIDGANPRLAHELECGARYSVVLTTSGGLYRYRLNDLIEVTGRWHECPMVKFVGRHAHLADWFGEKLAEEHVARALQEAFSALQISPAFAMLACEAESAAPAYVLYLDAAESAATLHAAAQRIEARLRENFHYDHARRLGQLHALRVARVKGAVEIYLDAKVRTGLRAGDVKPLALDAGAGWAQAFSRGA